MNVMDVMDVHKTLGVEWISDLNCLVWVSHVPQCAFRPAKQGQRLNTFMCPCALILSLACTLPALTFILR